MSATQDHTRADIAETLTHLVFEAKRVVPVVGTAEFPTKWDEWHQLIDDLITDWQGSE